MPPQLLKLEKDLSNLEDIAQRVAIFLEKHNVGVIPTETLYGLAADPFSQKALEKLFLIKKRPQKKPILLLIEDIEQLYFLVEEIPPIAEKLIEKFWPGPLTIVFPAKKNLSPYLTAGTGTIGIRLSSSPIVKAIIKAFGKPITGTSANLSNQPACSSPEEVMDQLSGLDFIVDYGYLETNAPSTVVSVVNNQLSLIRTGAIPFKDILTFFL
ncbi:threonylcarbamoyl-AMP synthase [Thermodesulfobacterium sp. TA1]|uniref:L-threonylcarbamoyladenylate synthase n=1 Tax=Thermodesulfobacterium sp. TA1 TaxID=2234087 RepID=UPI001231F888|nr:L-threonylcarbamoyladenylate synthase [Thermodesulfobacterium sp. TA1]QER41566.1 threonylcarbamoyl-AMP synthase [Thermodesulfobacterium sp. TA1]